MMSMLHKPGAGHVTRMGDKIKTGEVFVRTPGGDRPLERRRRRYEDNIQINLKLVRMASTGFVWFWIQKMGVIFWKGDELLVG
jgi:hypothetical protein